MTYKKIPIGKNIKDIRIKKGISQDELAARLCVMDIQFPEVQFQILKQERET